MGTWWVHPHGVDSSSVSSIYRQRGGLIGLLSDLTVTNRRSLVNGKLNGMIPIVLSLQSQWWMLVNQEKPAEVEWRQWRKANPPWSMLGDSRQDLSQRRISNFAYRYQCNVFFSRQSGYRRCQLVRPNKFGKRDKLSQRSTYPYGHTQLR